MNDLQRFRESFFKGRLIWVRGSSGACKVSTTYEFLKYADVDDCEVLTLDAFQFVDGFRDGIPKYNWSRFRTLIIRAIDELDEARWVEFLKCMQYQRGLRFQFEVRTILVCSNEIAFAKKLQILEMKPVVIDVGGEGNDSDPDRRLHHLISIASKLAKKKILRVSERAAVFFETILDDCDDQELLELLFWGIFRSENSILRFSDLFSSEALESSAKRDVVTN